MRAMVLYPMHALVEDQLVRLRRSLDSPAARTWLDKNRRENRFYFGRYTGQTPVSGQRYPSFAWGGNILMGSGTPNHVNDPIVSGVWRPRNPNQYFEDDPSGNIACVGAWQSDIAGISELSSLYQSGRVEPTCLLTSTHHITAADIGSANGLAAVERD